MLRITFCIKHCLKLDKNFKTVYSRNLKFLLVEMIYRCQQECLWCFKAFFHVFVNAAIYSLKWFSIHI